MGRIAEQCSEPALLVKEARGIQIATNIPPLALAGGERTARIPERLAPVSGLRIGEDIKISGAVSMDDQGDPTAVDDLEQQMKNAYSDLAKVLEHYGCTFDDVIVENVFTTDMAKFLEVSSYRSSIYTKQFPTGSWLEVKGLALPGLMIEIELEAHRSR